MLGDGSCYTLRGAVDAERDGCTLGGCTDGSTLRYFVAGQVIGVDNVVGIGTVVNMGGISKRG